MRTEGPRTIMSAAALSLSTAGRAFLLCPLLTKARSWPDGNSYLRTQFNDASIRVNGLKRKPFSMVSSTSRRLYAYEVCKGRALMHVRPWTVQQICRRSVVNAANVIRKPSGGFIYLDPLIFLGTSPPTWRRDRSSLKLIRSRKSLR